MKIVICDQLGLAYDGSTLEKRGLGGSESAVILMAKELTNIGFDVTVFNSCIDNEAKPGTYDDVTYLDHTQVYQYTDTPDIFISSRTISPFLSSNQYNNIAERSKKTILWLHDTFVDGDELMEDLVVSGKIDHVFTLSDWHTSYILTCAHGRKRNHEVLKRSIFQTRNGAVCHIPEVDLSQKDPNHFIYNASATKGMVPLVDDIWPSIKEQIPQAKLTIVGGYYRFREGAEPDAQENIVAQLASRQDLKDLDVTFTGVIPQYEIAKLLANANMMLYPAAFPETFGISTIESLLYKTPLVTNRFGALEETAVEQACYLIDYAIEPNNLFPHIDKDDQIGKFLQKFFEAYNNPYLHQQKQNYCDVIKDISGWDTVALQWKQFFYSILNDFLPVNEYREVTRINDKISRIFGRTSIMPTLKTYSSYGSEKRIVIVSPFYNAENYIEKHIRSVASQDYDNYLHILIDDASTDNSYQIAKQTVSDANTDSIVLNKRETNKGCIFNQLSVIEEYVNEDDIVVFLDGDDWLINNNTIFQYYNDLYKQGYEFTYGSMWSVVDNIPLISQEYPDEVKKNGTYRNYHFNWKIPYTHLRTTLGEHCLELNKEVFMINGEWMKSGADNPMFYELIEKVDPKKIYCNREIICNYNDANPLNDYKVRGTEQNRNANLSYGAKNQLKRILVAIPTNKYIEVETMESLWELDAPPGYKLDLKHFHGYRIDQIRNLIAEWAKNYDYLLSVDSDIILPKDALNKMVAADKDMVSGLYIQRIPDTHTLEVYMDTQGGGCTNIPYNLMKGIDEVVEIAACGMGAVLIKSEVFRRMEYPHFHYKSALDHRDTVSEDVFFCKKARETGFTIWADPSIKCDHKGSDFFRVDQDKTHLEKVAEHDLLPKQHAEYLKSMDINPKVVYDIGACVQHWTRKAKETWPNAKYYLIDASNSVEPFLNTNEYAITVLSDQDGNVVNFYENVENPGGNSYYLETTGAFTEEHKTKRTTSTLDTIVKQNNWLKPDLIKLDVQGAELDVLLGAKETLSDCSDIILECQHTNYNDGAPKFDDVKQYLENLGYHLVTVIHKTEVDGDYHFSKNYK